MNADQFIGVIPFAIGGIILLVAIASSITMVPQQSLVIIQRLGKFQRIAVAGMSLRVPFIDSTVGKLNLRLQQVEVPVETKSRDNVFVTLSVAVQYQVRLQEAYEAFYRLNDPVDQIKSYVFDSVRAKVPTMLLDDVFENKDDIADAVKAQLNTVMEEFGYDIIKALVTDVTPAQNVVDAMNEINAAQRLRVAATEQGEASKILLVKNAEAEAEAKRLSGQGIANQRKAIIAGLQESVELFREAVVGSSPQDVMNLVMMTQYFDTLQSLGDGANAKVVFLPHVPGNITSIQDQIMSGTMMAEAAAEGNAS